MATVQTANELKRLEQLTGITRAFRSRFPEAPHQRIGLNDIAKLCKSLISSLSSRDCHDVRDEVLAIACLWDLTRDALEEQSDDLLDCLAAFIADKGHGSRLWQ